MSETLSPFVEVPMHVARNPVARAVAKARITNAVRDFQLRLYHLASGDNVAADVHAAMQVLTCCLIAMELCGRAAEPSAAVMRGAQSALIQCAKRGSTWRESDAPAVDMGLQRAVEILPKLPAREVALAWRQLREMARWHSHEATDRRSARADPAAPRPPDRSAARMQARRASCDGGAGARGVVAAGDAAERSR